MFSQKTHLEKTSITLRMLFDAGLLKVGQEVFSANPEASGVINKDGSLKVFYQGREKNFPFLSGAARYVENRSLNGWIYWFVEEGGQRKSLDSIREQYLKMKDTL